MDGLRPFFISQMTALSKRKCGQFLKSKKQKKTTDFLVFQIFFLKKSISIRLKHVTCTCTVHELIESPKL